MDAALSAKRRDVKIIGMVGVAHLFSHLYQLALPPLFPLIRAELEVSYTSLGLLMGTFYLVSGVMQTPAGFLVDRIGARPVLLGGLGFLAGATALFGFAQSYETMMLLAILGGLGNSVFHPADFVILSGDPFSVYTRVEETWVEGVKVFDRTDADDLLHAEGGWGAADDVTPYLCCHGDGASEGGR